MMNIPLILVYGAKGAIIGTGITGLLTVIPETILTLRLTGARYPAIFIAKVTAASAAGWVVAFWLRGPDLFHLITAGTAGLGTLAIALALVKPLGPAEQALLGRASPKLRPLLSRFG